MQTIFCGVSIMRSTLASGYAACGEVRDLVLGVAELGEDRRRVDAEERGRRVVPDALAIDLERQRDRLDAVERLQHPARARLLVLRDLREILDRCDGDAFEQLEPFSGRTRGELPANQRQQRLAVR